MTIFRCEESFRLYSVSILRALPSGQVGNSRDLAACNSLQRRGVMMLTGVEAQVGADRRWKDHHQVKHRSTLPRDIYPLYLLENSCSLQLVWGAGVVGVQTSSKQNPRSNLSAPNRLKTRRFMVSNNIVRRTVFFHIIMYKQFLKGFQNTLFTPLMIGEKGVPANAKLGRTRGTIEF